MPSRSRPRRPVNGVRRVARVGAVLLVAALAGVVGVLGAPAAQAHAYLTTSNPADGAALQSAPSHLLLDFSESVVLAATSVTVVDAAGHRVTVGAPQLVGPDGSRGGASASGTPGATDTEEPVSLGVALPELDKGSYRVSWVTVSSDDLHRAAGVIVFGVRTSVAAEGWVETAPDVLESALRWLVLVAIAGAVGVPVARILLRRTAPELDGGVTGPALRAAAAVGLLASVLLLADQLATSGATADALLSSGYAARWGLRTAGLFVVLSAGLAEEVGGNRTRSGRVVQSALLTGAALAALGTAMLGHSGSGLTGSPTRVLAAAAHVLAMGCWMGTLAVLLLVVLRRRVPGRTVRRILRAFGPVAATSVGVLVVTGLYLASGVVGSVDALLLTDYGRILVAKVLVVLGCGVLGLATRRRLRRSGAIGRAGVRLVVGEVALGGLVLVLTGLLSGGQPALERQLMADPGAPASTTAYQRVSDLEVSVAIRPNLPGENVAIVRVSNSRRPAPAPVTVVTVAAGVPGGTALATAIGDDQWSVPLTLTESGPGTVRVTVVRPGLRDTTGVIPWTTGWHPGSPPVLVSRAPLPPLLAWAAFVALLAFCLGLVVAVRAAAMRPPRRRAEPRAVAPEASRRTG